MKHIAILAIFLATMMSAQAGVIPVKDEEVYEGFPAFIDACPRYEWLCDNVHDGDGTYTDAELRDLATFTNQAVNDMVTSKRDIDLYGISDYWTIPYNGFGDCEDYAMLKKLMLLQRGVDPERLFMVVARLPSSNEYHAVLAIRLEDGDYIMDNLTNEFLHWRDTNLEIHSKQITSEKRNWYYADERTSPIVAGN